MSGFLPDTNVLSEFNRRGQPDRGVQQWLEAADPESLYVSVLTIGEIRLGVELLPPSKRRSQLEQWLERDLPEWFQDRILPVDQSIAERWGLLRAQAQMKGRPASFGHRCITRSNRSPAQPDSRVAQRNRFPGRWIGYR